MNTPIDPHIAATIARQDRVADLAVNIPTFIRELHCHHPDDSEVALALYRAANGRMPETEEEFGKAFALDGLPDELPLGALLRLMPGSAALRALECVNDDIIYGMENLIHAIAVEFVMPELARTNHPAYVSAVEVVNAYRGWIDNAGPAAAERYALAAYGFRDAWVGWEAEDPGLYRGLLEALPINGVDDGCYNGPRPALYWESFGYYLGAVSAEGQLIETLRERLNADDPSDEADNGLEAWWNETLDAQIERIEADQLAAHDEALRRLILDTLAASFIGQ